jgi:hypothetical protein
MKIIKLKELKVSLQVGISDTLTEWRATRAEEAAQQLAGAVVGVALGSACSHRGRLASLAALRGAAASGRIAGAHPRRRDLLGDNEEEIWVAAA